MKTGPDEMEYRKTIKRHLFYTETTFYLSIVLGVIALSYSYSTFGKVTWIVALGCAISSFILIVKMAWLFDKNPLLWIAGMLIFFPAGPFVALYRIQKLADKVLIIPLSPQTSSS